jgi:hypothetical protein
MSRSLTLAGMTAAAMLSFGLTTAATTAVASAAPATTYVATCLTQSVTPSEITISCADDGRYINHITWSNWGSAQALGRGTLNWNTCTPTCAAGTFLHKSISFRATTKKVLHGKSTYTVLVGPAGDWGTSSTTWTLITG